MDYYSDIAAGYDELHGKEQDAKLRELLSRVEILPQATVLDVGCGTGRSADMLECTWHGIDPSPGLIAQAPAGVRSRILQGKAESLPYPDASFDVVLSLTALQNFDDPGRGVSEMVRVCKPGGLLLISFLKKSSKAVALDALLRSSLRIEESWEQQHDFLYIARGPEK